MASKRLFSAGRLSSASSLPRPLDFTYPSNRWAAAGLGLGVVVAKVLGHSWPASLRIGLGTFSGWAISRELDPDHAQTALIAMPLAFVASLARPADAVEQPEGPGSLRHALPGFAALSSTRALAATVGPAPDAKDAAALGLQAAVTALSGGSVASLLPGAALAWSSQARDRFSAPPLAGLGVLAAGALPNAGRSAGHSVLADLLSLTALGLSQQLAAPERIGSSCDLISATVSAERVQAARMLSLGTLALGLVRRETLSLAPLAAACVSVAARRTLHR